MGCRVEESGYLCLLGDGARVKVARLQASERHGAK